MAAARDKSYGSRGQAMVEFAVTAAALLLITTSIMMGAQAVMAYNSMSAAAEEAVRYAVAYGPNSPSPASTDTIEGMAAGVAPQLHLTKTVFDAHGNVTFAGNVTATWVADANMTTRQDARVVVAYDFPLKIPLMSTVTLHLTATSQMMASQ